MKWFIAKLVYEVKLDKLPETGQFDEQLRLVYAEDDLQAFYKARLLGESEKLDEIIPFIKWKFIDVSELHLLSEYNDGAEVFSMIRQESNQSKFIASVQKRASSILQDSLHQFTG